MLLGIGKLVNYSNLKIFKALLFVKIKLDQLDGKTVKCVFIVSSKCGKGYKLWEVESEGSRFIISWYITFGETCKQTKKRYVEVKELETMIEKIQYKVEVPYRETKDNEEFKAPDFNSIEEIFLQ